ncbi:hypothetical protein EON65_08780 [archaeon]|nr:MAG: hypothetical protein EON65_08780 [archaeon]
MYYQSNQFFSVPINCQESISNPSAVDSLVACPSMATIYNAFVSSVCEDSFEKVCKAAYTDNPPFSCSKTVYPTWITCLATAFANASGVLAVTFVIIKVLLRQIQYHYVHEFEYDRKKERYHDLDHRRIHASLDEYIAGLEEGRMVVSDKVAFQFRKKNRNVLDNSNKEADRSLMGMADDSPKKDDDVDVITYPQAYDTVHSHNTNVDQVTKEHKQ